MRAKEVILQSLQHIIGEVEKRQSTDIQNRVVYCNQCRLLFDTYPILTCHSFNYSLLNIKEIEWEIFIFKCYMVETINSV